MSRFQKKKQNLSKEDRKESLLGLKPETKKSIFLVICLGIAFLLILAAAHQAGPAGNLVFHFLDKLFGWGYYFLPAVFFLIAFSMAASPVPALLGTTLLGVLLFLVSALGFIDLIAPGSGGFIGSAIGLLELLFGPTAALSITLILLIISFLILFNKPLKVPSFKKTPRQPAEAETEITAASVLKSVEATTEITETPSKVIKSPEIKINLPKETKEKALTNEAVSLNKTNHTYISPPLSLLSASVEKPTFGDLRSNANIIKRTLESFGLSVEMGEINVGPTITRYTLKPAEGIKLSKITALSQDLALALAAHPIRIEAPIPGKSLVGIEVPNKVGALVRLGTLLRYPEIQKAGPLTFVLGRNISGEPVLADIAKMPHLLIAGATGSGKSIAIHSMLLTLLYKNSPETLRLILIDPKRVELSVYNDLPHLVLPVVTENKKAINVLKWAIQEMEDRYQKLLEAGTRDIKTYNQRNTKNPLPYILIVIDELADLMSSYGREVEGAIIRLAQMSRATGLHLVVSTQRPSVEVITGLIKANITARIAMQVASQVDSRTILDMAGAEKLLGHGDLLFLSAEFSKPQRIQGVYVTEEEIKAVTNFIRENNPPDYKNSNLSTVNDFDWVSNFENSKDADDEDELYEEAVAVVKMAKKASASLLQRRLKIGYARAARLLDIMETKGLIGPAEGAKPREVFLNNGE